MSYTWNIAVLTAHLQANASAKRVAARNEKAIRNLRLGMVICTGLSIAVRLLLRRHTFLSTFSILVYAVTFAPSAFLYSFLVRTGTPRRDASGMLLSPGDDLNQAGLTDWSWDVIYVTWACQLGSSFFGDWVWWIYLVVSLQFVDFSGLSYNFDGRYLCMLGTVLGPPSSPRCYSGDPPD